MKVEGRHYRAIWPAEDGRAVEIIDQTRLPHAFIVVQLTTVEQAVDTAEALAESLGEGSGLATEADIDRLAPASTPWRMGSPCG